ncbi:molybdopterin molybdotransferase MoeA [Hyphococcus flavus]|uniref:Molybdopterin molybdenumtransferase n=1 Tax=Hyphococcus flavus TaxID=1866326 RepID=A0AAE9ZB79_9PROT|nr:gephyrin-like molybdotransferase Glp [Hyphococcus flavus]WDI31339.1 molybdopterin molybdotransferase MoeA [Hyphococcus flavus]
MSKNPAASLVTLTVASKMLSVDEAISAILENTERLEPETVPLEALPGRIAAKDVSAQITQPPFAASAMDGYAVRFADASVGATLTVIGEAPAGAPYSGMVDKGEAVRIFTGAAVPDGTDHVIIQEDVTRNDVHIQIREPQDEPRHIRQAGIDFKQGDILVRAGERLHEIHGSVLAAANLAGAQVYRRPKSAVFSNGDELVEPGSTLKPGQIVNSNHYALAAMVSGWGGSSEYLGRAVDSEDAIRAYFRRGRDADIIIPIGGASVGDYDFVKSAFKKEGGELVFEKVAVRPGKPTWFGKLGNASVVGLPGNPASAIVTAALFVQPLMRRLAGESVQGAPVFHKAALVTPLEANGARESYLRAKASLTSSGLTVSAASNQDSSLLTPFSKANCLIRRLANASAAAKNDAVDIVWLR